MGILNRRTLRTLHNWIGLFLSVVLVILSLSGTLLIFKDDYLRATIPAASVKLNYSAEKFGKAVAKIEQQTQKSPISYISFAHKGSSLHRIVYQDGSAAYADQLGNIIKYWDKNGTLEDWIFHLHHYLFLGDFGKLFSGAIGFFAIFMAITGLIILWPALKAFRWRITPRSLKRADLMSQHRDLGLIFFLPITILMFTGASMVYSTPAKILLSAATFSGTSNFERPTASAGKINWPKALMQAQKQFPTARLTIVSGAKNKNSAASVRIKQADEWHQNGRTYAYINPSTSEVISVKDALSMTRAERGFQMLYPIHSAAVGGRIVDVIYTLTGLALIVLSLVGSWTFIKRLRRW